MSADHTGAGMISWFDGVTPCPKCHHTSYDHCVCVDAHGVELFDPPCTCWHECHFDGVIVAGETEPEAQAT